MTVQEVLTQLESLSNEKMMAINTKAGAGKNQFGVKMGDIRNIAKKLKTNHELGLQLWNAGNIEAQFLAILIMKPDLLTAKQLDTMVQQIDFTHVADWFSSYILKDRY